MNFPGPQIDESLSSPTDDATLPSGGGLVASTVSMVTTAASSSGVVSVALNELLGSRARRANLQRWKTGMLALFLSLL